MADETGEKKFKKYVPGAKANKKEKYQVSEAAKVWAANIIKDCTNKRTHKGEVTYWYSNAYRTRDGLLQLKMSSTHRKAIKRLDPAFQEKERAYQNREDVRERK